MEPTLAHGDRLVVVRRRHVRAGQIVAATDPRSPDRVLVKRIAAVGGGGVTLAGDNPAESTDSRTFGPVARSAVLGVVVYRYHPTPRWFLDAGRRIG